MNRSIYTTLLFLLSLILLLDSCGDSFSTVLEIDPPEFEKQMSLFADISAGDQSVVFWAGQNRGILETGSWEDYDITGANLSITNIDSGINYDSTNVIFGFNGENYLYRNLDEDFFRDSDSYDFVLDHPDFEPLSTTLTFPRQGKLENISYEYEDGIYLEGDEASSITFDIVDDPDEANFYELELFRQTGPMSSQSSRELEIFTTDPTGLKGFPDENLFFSDESFNGQRRQIIVKFDRFRFDPESDDELVLKWRSINEGYYKYRISLERFLDTDETPFVSPVQVFSNVNNGFGVVSLSSEVVYPIE